MLPPIVLRQVLGRMCGSGKEIGIVRPAVIPVLYLSTYTLDDWKGHRILGVPKKSADNYDVDIILTGLHWHNTSSGGGDERLITTYRHHGIQCVLFCSLLSTMLNLKNKLGYGMWNK